MKKVVKFLCLLCLLLPHSLKAQNNSSKSYGFIQNKGQVIDQKGDKNSDVLYLLSEKNGINIQLKSNGFAYDSYQQFSKEQLAFHRLDIELVNINPEVEIVEEKASQDYINYYTTGLSDNSAFNSKHFESILYKGVYPNIDLRFNSQNGVFKFDFILHKGARLEDIQLKYSGFNSASLAENINFELSFGALSEFIPKSWIIETNEEVAVNYVILSETQNELVIGYQTNSGIDLSKNSLLIDPTLTMDWATYYGDTLIDRGTDVMTDKNGFVYMTGYTQSYTNLATSGVHQDTMSGGLFDAFVIKTNEYGMELWSTYYGGIGEDISNSIMVDTFFNVTITGSTNSIDGIASDSCFLNIYSGGQDIFVAQFDDNGQRLWSTYLGSSGDEIGNAVDTDYDGFVYVAGQTDNSSSLATSGAHQIANNGLTDGFFIKLDTFGFPMWSSYYGGSGDDIIHSIAQEGNQILIAGTTNSTSDIASSGAHQTSLAGQEDAFLASFDQSGIRNWASYYGDVADDHAADVDIYNTRIYLLGKTDSDTNLATAGAYKMSADSIDAFLVKFDTLGNLMWGTYFGGEGVDEGIELGVELDSNIYIFGNTSSNLNIASYDNYDTTYNGGVDAFIAKFHYNGYFLHASYYGGPEDDVLTGGDVYGNTALYLCGATKSLDSIAFNSWIQDTLAGLEDAFLTRFNTKKSTICNGVSTGFASDTICQDTINIMLIGGALGAGANWHWYLNACGPSGTLLGIGDTLSYFPPAGNVSIFVRAESVNNSTNCSWINLYVMPKPVVNITVNDSVLCKNDSLILSSSLADYYSWSGPNGFSDILQTTVIDSLDTINSGMYYLTITDSYGCKASDSIDVLVNINPSTSYSVVNTTCIGNLDGEIVVTAQGSGDLTYVWEHTSADTSQLFNLAAGLYVLTVSDSNLCSTLDSIVVQNPPSPVINSTITANDCEANNGAVDIDVSGNPGAYTYLWTPTSSTNQDLTNLSDGSYSLSITDSNACVFSETFIVPYQNNLLIDSVLVQHETCFGDEDGSATINLLSGEAPFNFNWTPVLSGSNNVSGLGAGTYIVEITDAYECYISDTIEIIAAPEILIVIDSLNHAFCDESTGYIYASSTGGLGGHDYSWSPIASSDSYLINLLGGNYTLMVTDSVGCSADTSITVIDYSSPSVTINAGTTLVGPGQSTNLEAQVSPIGTYTYLWSPSSNLDCDSCQQVVASPTIDETYSVTVTDTNGCKGYADVELIIDRCKDYFLPTIFSPNNDQLNDDWTLMGDCVEAFNLKVFNRWGEVIYAGDANSYPWNGDFKGKRVGNGSYVYQLEIQFHDGLSESVSGTVKVVK